MSRNTWISEDLTEVLASERYEAEDELYGRGEGHFFGPAFEARAAFYPAKKAIEFEDPNVYVVFKKPSRLLIADEAVFVSTRNGDHWTHASFGRNGMFGMVSHNTFEVPEPTNEDPAAPEENRATPETVSLKGDDDRLDGGPTNNLGPSTEPSTEKQETERFIGSVGAEPNFHLTSKGVPRIIFPLDTDNGRETVYSTKQRAEAIRDQQLKPGEKVRVSGVRHQWTGSDNEPTSRIYAWGIKRQEANGNH